MCYLTFVHQQNQEKDGAHEDHDNAMTNAATKSEKNTITISIPSNRNLTYSRPDSNYDRQFFFFISIRCSVQSFSHLTHS